MKIKLPKASFRRKKAEENEELNKRITNQNLSEHREKVLEGGKKYIYPLRHSKRKLVTISISLFLIAVIAFFTYSVLSLYKFKSESQFTYQITKVIPFPIARVGSDFVQYESYLFEINRYKHYFHSQQNVDFNSTSGKQQLEDYRKRALDKVINDEYVRKLAEENNISVSTQEVNEEVSIYKAQNRLGTNDDQLKTVLKDFYDWTIDDFKASLKQQLLTRKVVAALDTETRQKAEDAEASLKSGKKFEDIAKQVSEDPTTKDSGGEFRFLIDKDNIDVSPRTVSALFALKPGQVSDIINVGYGLEIVKNIEQKDGKIKAAHIVFNFKNIDSYMGEIKDRVDTRTYVSF